MEKTKDVYALAENLDSLRSALMSGSLSQEQEFILSGHPKSMIWTILMKS